MKNSVVQFSQYSLEDFMGLLEEKITQAVEKVQFKKNPDDGRDFYTRSETANILKVSLTTLHNWAKEGVLNPQKMGSRVYYQKSEVFEKLNIKA